MGIETAIIGSGLVGAYSSNKAAKAQTDATNQANATQLEMFNKQNELNAPFRENGLAGQNRLAELLGIGGNKSASDYGSAMKDFGMSDYQADPGYSFRLSEGVRALDQSAAARGGLLSGNALKASQKYGQDMGSQEYQNAYNRYQTNRSNKLNALQSMAGQGQTATNTMTNAAANYGSAVAGNQMAAGDARASGYVGGANALTSALGTGLNYYSQQNMANALRSRNRG